MEFNAKLYATSESVLSSKIYDKVQDHNLDLVPTSKKLIMGDGRTIKALSIACNLNVIISVKCIPTDFFVIDTHCDKHDDIILGRPFFKLVDVVFDAEDGKVTINLNGDKYTYDFLHTSSFASPFPHEDEEEEEVGSLCLIETLRDPLQRTMENQSNDQQDKKLEEETKGLEPQDGSVEAEKFKDIRDTRPEKPQVPEVDLKHFPKGLKYEFLGLDKTYPVIMSDELSHEENEKLLNLLKKHKKVIMISRDLAQPFALIVYQCKIVLDHQRSLTHSMREVVKKEVIKLLYVGIIYPVPHSEW
jgi:hypothetical protein